MTFHIFLALCAFLMTLLGTRISVLAMRARREALGLNRLSQQAHQFLPDSIQGGGIVLVFAAVVCLTIADIRYGVILALLLLAAVCLLEKLAHVPWLLRMMVQVVAISFPLSTFAEPTFGGMFPQWVDIMLTGALWIWFINLFAGMDDLEGLPATGMLSIAAGLYIAMAVAGLFPGTLASYSLITAAAAAGFLWWNWPPAKIAMGRVGSLPSGLLLGYLLLLAAHNGYVIIALMLPAYFIADSLASWARRTWSGNTMAMVHDSHYYQLAIYNGRSKPFIVRSIMGIHILLIFLSVYSLIEPELALYHLLIAYLCVLVLLGFFANPSRNRK